MWDDLSTQQKAQIMKMAIANGLTGLDEIKSFYNNYSSMPLSKIPADYSKDNYFANGGKKQTAKQAVQHKGWVYRGNPYLYIPPETPPIVALRMAGVPLNIHDYTGRIRAQNASYGVKNSHHKRGWRGSTIYGSAVDMTPAPGYTYDDLIKALANPALMEWARANGFGLLDERPASVRARTNATGPHLHFGPDSRISKLWDSPLLVPHYSYWDAIRPFYYQNLQQQLRKPVQQPEQQRKLTWDNASSLSWLNSNTPYKPTMMDRINVATSNLLYGSTREQQVPYASTEQSLPIEYPTIGDFEFPTPMTLQQWYAANINNAQQPKQPVKPVEQKVEAIPEGSPLRESPNELYYNAVQQKQLEDRLDKLIATNNKKNTPSFSLPALAASIVSANESPEWQSYEFTPIASNPYLAYDFTPREVTSATPITDSILGRVAKDGGRIAHYYGIGDWLHNLFTPASKLAQERTQAAVKAAKEGYLSLNEAKRLSSQPLVKPADIKSSMKSKRLARDTQNANALQKAYTSSSERPFVPIIDEQGNTRYTQIQNPSAAGKGGFDNALNDAIFGAITGPLGISNTLKYSPKVAATVGQLAGDIAAWETGKLTYDTTASYLTPNTPSFGSQVEYLTGIPEWAAEFFNPASIMSVNKYKNLFNVADGATRLAEASMNHATMNSANSKYLQSFNDLGEHAKNWYNNKSLARYNYFSPNSLLNQNVRRNLLTHLDPYTYDLEKIYTEVVPAAKNAFKETIQKKLHPIRGEEGAVYNWKGNTLKEINELPDLLNRHNALARYLGLDTSEIMPMAAFGEKSPIGEFRFDNNGHAIFHYYNPTGNGEYDTRDIISNLSGLKNIESPNYGVGSDNFFGTFGHTGGAYVNKIPFKDASFRRYGKTPVVSKEDWAKGVRAKAPVEDTEAYLKLWDTWDLQPFQNLKTINLFGKSFKVPKFIRNFEVSQVIPGAKPFSVEWYIPKTKTEVEEVNNMLRQMGKPLIEPIRDVPKDYLNQEWQFAEGGTLPGYNYWADKVGKYKGINMNDRSYDYKGFYNNNPLEAYSMLFNNPNAHFDDRYKTVYHPTFSTLSDYSGKIDSAFNPNGLVGGTWGKYSDGRDAFKMSPDLYRGPVSMDDRIDYLINNENNGAVLLEADGSLPKMQDGSLWGGVLPNITIIKKKTKK